MNSCPMCLGHPLKAVLTTLSAIDADGGPVLITGVPALECPGCGEHLYDVSVEDKLAVLLTKPPVGESRIIAFDN